jgi:hypothetical protein
MSFDETVFARPMTPAMQRAADEIEVRMEAMGEDSPEARAFADLYDKARMTQLMFESLAIPYGAADVIEGVRQFFDREEFEYLRPDLDGAPLPANVVTFQPPAAS